jgi:predicted DCC family thiol-disulfide oxidoreductase YuxK
VYDGLCPACAAYFRLMRIREIGLRLVLVDARSNPRIFESYLKRGIDLDRTFVLRIGDMEYTGGEAMFVLSRLGASLTFFRRLNSAIFGSRRKAETVYPLFSFARRMLLRMSGLPLIAR